MAVLKEKPLQEIQMFFLRKLFIYWVRCRLLSPEARNSLMTVLAIFRMSHRLDLCRVSTTGGPNADSVSWNGRMEIAEFDIVESTGRSEGVKLLVSSISKCTRRQLQRCTVFSQVRRRFDFLGGVFLMLSIIFALWLPSASSNIWSSSWLHCKCKSDLLIHASVCARPVLISIFSSCTCLTFEKFGVPGGICPRARSDDKFEFLRQKCFLSFRRATESSILFISSAIVPPLSIALFFVQQRLLWNL